MEFVIPWRNIRYVIIKKFNTLRGLNVDETDVDTELDKLVYNS